MNLKQQVRSEPSRKATLACCALCLVVLFADLVLDELLGLGRKRWKVAAVPVLQFANFACKAQCPAKSSVRNVLCVPNTCAVQSGNLSGVYPAKTKVPR